MTLTEMKAMFKPGDVWIGTRTFGHAGAVPSITRRVIKQVRSADYICEPLTPGTSVFYGSLPKARDVIEARPGYLLFRIPVKGPQDASSGAIVELVKERTR